jgi:glycosyltransferase involved in cell wall biosynthesis
MTAESPATLRVCITLPFFSNLEYLDIAVRSLLAQTESDWTAIVVDDASPESGAAEVVARLDDPRVRFLRNDHNLGISGNFNRCLELGSEQADLVAVLHADDMLEPEYVATMRRVHATFPHATCIAPMVSVIGSSGRANRTLGDSVKHFLTPRSLPATFAGDDGLAKLMHGLFFYCPAVSYRVERLSGLRFDDRWRQVMDLDFYARVLLTGGSIVCVPDRVYRYRRHEATMTAQNSRSLVRLEEEVSVSREVGAEAERRGWHRAARAARLRATIRLNGLLQAARLVVRGHVRAAGGAVRGAVSR